MGDGFNRILEEANHNFTKENQYIQIIRAIILC